jgi:uncharacterized zinc-type alcohol dehydrogenase-like protein
MIRAYAAQTAGGPLARFDYDPGPLGPDQVEINVTACGICHSDLSMLNNEWGMTAFPFVPGHEAIGRIGAIGSQVTSRQVGETVGLGWVSASCMTCPQCMAGDHNLCQRGESTIVARHGGFADKVRCHAAWAIPLPSGLDPRRAGPLFCGGITVFHPILDLGVRPTDRVGVVGIGGLGHLAMQFLVAWGCEVTAFTTSDNKRDEALGMGAHHVVNTRDGAQLDAIAGTLDFILSTVNVPLDWNRFLGVLAPRGRLHTVGAVLEPIPVPAFGLISGQKTVSGSPLGSPETIRRMLEFCVRHGIMTTTEFFPLSRANEAIAHLASGKARYRVVLENDLSPL